MTPSSALPVHSVAPLHPIEMDGRNSSGARVSLLNDWPAEADRLAGRRPSALPLSRTSSFSSIYHNNSSPPTPQLVRSHSSDSATMQRTPSPITPVEFAFDPHQLSRHGSDAYSLSQHPSPSYFPKDAQSSFHLSMGQHPSPTAFAYPLPGSASLTAQPPVPLYPAHQHPAGAQQQQLPAPKQPGKKNQYPCPLAKEFSCSHFFTTSGHAARHAKKHTGKKDAFCPECNKAFTRKDNMEQHRRTHQNGRNASKHSLDHAALNSHKRQKAAASLAKRPRPTPLHSTGSSIDPAMPISPASSFGYSDAGLGLSTPHAYPAELLGQHSYTAASSPYPVTPYYDATNLSGLDKLAMAASGAGSRPGF